MNETHPGQGTGQGTDPTAAAESLRQKGHDLASSAKEGVGAVGDRVEQANEFIHRAQRVIDDAERRLNEVIDTAERLFTRGTEYSNRARAWMNEHQDYKDRAQHLVERAARLRDKVRPSSPGGGPAAEDTGPGRLESMRDAGRRGLGSLGAQASGGARRASAFVRENPADALLVGAAFGVLVGTALKHLRGDEYVSEEIGATGETAFEEGENRYGL